MECHHLLPLSQSGVTTTRLSDLALVCSNCHRVLHAPGFNPTLVQLREALQRP